MANPIDVMIVGQALNDEGLAAKGTISGVGLNTFGFLWPEDAIWTVCSCPDPTSTTWTEDCCE